MSPTEYVQKLQSLLIHAGVRRQETRRGRIVVEGWSIMHHPASRVVGHIPSSYSIYCPSAQVSTIAATLAGAGIKHSVSDLGDVGSAFSIYPSIRSKHLAVRP